MQNGRDSKHLVRACQALFDGAGTDGNPQMAPHLSMWLRGAYSPPAETLLEIAEIVIRRLLDEKPPEKASAALEAWLAGQSTRLQELLSVRMEAEVHRLETVLTRANATALRQQSNHVRARSRVLRNPYRRAQTPEPVEELPATN